MGVCGRGFIGLALVFATSASAAVDLSGFVAGEVRHFADAPKHVGQLSGRQSSLILAPQMRWRAQNGDRYTLIAHARHDDRDSERSHADVREAYWLRINERWTWLVGVNRVFWGVAESRHLVDIINQTDAVESFDGEEKLGQLMVNLGAQRDWGNLSLFVLPGFREPTFPGASGRLRLALPVDRDSAVYESSARARHTDWAMRYSHYIGQLDVGFYYFYGTGREPRLAPNVDRTRLIAHYDLIHQTGIDLQYTHDAWLWKFEGIVRKGQGRRFSAVVAGLEYTFFGMVGTGVDFGLLAEYLYDGRDPNPVLAPPTLFDDDYFLGVRLALNDAQDSNVVLGVIEDLDDHVRLFSIEAERRLGANWTIAVEGRWFQGVRAGSDISAFSEDSFLSLRLARHF